MNVENRIAQRANCGWNVNALPEEVTRIEIDPEVRPNRRTKLQHRLHVVDDEPGVGFQRDLDAVVGCVLGRFDPVRNGLLLPLPLQHVQEFRWPRRRYPVRVTRIVGIARTPGERDNHRHLHAAGEANGLPELRIVFARSRAIRMQRIAVAREGTDGQSRILQHASIGRGGRSIIKERVRVEMIAPWPSAGSQFERLDLSKCADPREHVLRGQTAENGREQT
jgi:hypothetical protein